MFSRLLAFLGTIAGFFILVGAGALFLFGGHPNMTDKEQEGLVTAVIIMAVVGVCMMGSCFWFLAEVEHGKSEFDG